MSKSNEVKFKLKKRKLKNGMEFVLELPEAQTGDKPNAILDMLMGKEKDIS